MKSVYHDGEKDVQARAGVRALSDRVGRIINSKIPEAAQEFLRRRTFLIVGSVDRNGSVWASILTGEPGFAHTIDDRNIKIDAAARSGDPLKENLIQSNPIGLLAIEFSAKHRMRVNGMAHLGQDGAIYLTSDQVYSNCPKYIQPRDWKGISNSTTGAVQESGSLTADQERWIARSDTFFIASYHPEAGADVSHRGGDAGFIQIENSNKLVWPDFVGNNMFQTLGNITSYPNSGLLFINFETGDTLQLTGKASIRWEPERRSVEFSIEKVLAK